MRIDLAAPGPDGLSLVSFGQPGRPGGWFTWQATDHELDDLEALLAARKARVRTCPEADGDHSCWMPPGHTAASHQCRACPYQWRTPDQLPLEWEPPARAPAQPC